MTHGDHTQDHQGVSNEVAATDAVTALRRAFSGFLGSGSKSDFEGRQLNDMLDLVEHGNPDELTNAGEALFRARDAISDAADELSGHISDVDWHGEAGTAFMKWGTQLVTNTRSLSEFAGGAGTQIQVAGSGLKSVQKSMPPRDTRVEQKTVDQLPAHKRVKGDPEYDAAVQVEGHRQEAINQMTRLSSFYSVASGALAGQEPPTFSPMPDVGVPKPAGGWDPIENGSNTTGDLRTVSSDDSTSHAKGEVPSQQQAQLDEHGKIYEPQHHHVSTKIDSVQTLPPDAPPTKVTPTPVTNPIEPTNNPSPPYADSFVKTGQNTSNPKAFGRTTAPQARGLAREATGGSKSVGQAGRTPTSATGRTPTSATGRGATNGMGRGATNAMGRGPVNQARGAGRAGATGGRMPMGRAGVTGGTPRAASPNKSSQAGAVRKGGVVGGRPNTAQTTGSSSRVPRGTVIGGRQESGGRPQGTAGKVGQRGVIGAQKPVENKPSAGRRTPGTPEGVVGTPKERTKGPKGQRAGFTSGGSGLVRGKGDQRRDSERDTENEDQTSPQLQQDTDGVQPPEPQHRPPHAPPAND